MVWAVKNWKQFQHFKDRTPPWVKLYRDILDDPDWHSLSGDVAKTLVMLWVIASEDETKQGLLPNDKKLAFRLRISEKSLQSIVSQLSHWLIHIDITAISDRYQVDAPERAPEETEGETEGEKHRDPTMEATGKQRGSAGEIPESQEGKGKERKGSAASPDKPAQFDFKSELMARGVDPVVAADWIEVRKKQKAANTQTALSGFLSEVEKSGMTVDAAVRECCARSWRGFKADWVPKSASSAPAVRDWI